MELRDYARLIDDFVSGRIPVSVFESRYLEAFKAETGDLSADTFEVLDGLFSDVDCYSPSCAPGMETRLEISEAMLRERAARALERLKV